MYCKNCGKEIEENSKYCQFCGTEQKQISKQKIIEEQTTPKESSGIAKTVLILFVIAVVTVAILLGVIACVTTQKNENKLSINIPKTLPVTYSDFKIEQYDNSITSVNLKVTAINELKNIEINVAFLDKNDVILEERVSKIDSLKKGESKVITYPITEMSWTTVKNVRKYTYQITKGYAIK